MSAARKLRVVTLVDIVSGQGGAERIAARLAMRLDHERFESTIVASRVDAAAPRPHQAVGIEEIERAGTRFIALGRSGRFDLHRWRPFLDLLRRERIDVLHAHMFGSNLYGAIIGRLAGVPVVVAHEHTWSFEGEPLRKLADRAIIARFSDRFIAVSREDRRRMIEIEKIDPDRITIVPNGIDPEPPPSGHDVRAELGVPADAPMVLAVGVLRAQKAFDVLVRATGLLAEHVPGVRVVIAGAGPDKHALESLAEELGVRENVIFAGLRKDVPDLLAATDVAALSSDYEGSPLAVMEYMGAGRAIVSTSVGGVPDLIDDEVHGLLVPPRDPAALAAGIERLLLDRELAARLGNAARERRLREFSFDNTVERVEHLYEELFAQSRRGRAEGFTPR